MFNSLNITLLVGILTIPLAWTPLLPISMIWVWSSWIIQLIIMLDILNGSATEMILSWMPNEELNEKNE